MLELSGPQWCARFPCSKRVEDLDDPFGVHAGAFVSALKKAGADVIISTTWRPAERAYLMHWAWAIAKGMVQPAAVPAMQGVEIQWVHRDGTDAVDLSASIAAAKAMVDGYNMAFQAELDTRHSLRLAIDMTITWRGTITVADARGVSHNCTQQADLWPIGASYGVHKLRIDRPHWSDNGH